MIKANSKLKDYYPDNRSHFMPKDKVINYYD